jgi:sec-independent protein translocase protein TatA
MLTALAQIAGLGLTEILLILLVVVLLFGATKIPEMARSLGKAKAEFKRGEEEGMRQLERERDEEELRRRAREAGIATEGKSAEELRRELARKP